VLSEKIGGVGLIRITTATAYVVAVLMSVFPTGAYFAISRTELRLVVEKEAMNGARLASSPVNLVQEMKKLQETDFTSLLTQRPSTTTLEIRRILDTTGAIVAESKDAIGIWPISARSPILGANGVMGEFEVCRSLSEIFCNVIGIAIVSLWFATWSFLFLRILPDRALKNALNEAIDSREAAQSAMLARDKAQEAARLRSIFLGNMSHELRTPLNGVLGMIDLVADTDLDPEQQAYVALAGSSGRHLLTIINDILDFSKLDEGNIEIISVSFILRELLMQTVDVFRSESQKKGVQLKSVIDDSLPEMIIGDSTRIRQILVSLIGNALKFTKIGNVTVTARMKIADKKTYVEFVVSDSGVGIHNEQLSYIFEPFTQVDESVTRLHGGAGLGLAISRQLAVAMGGNLWASSELGRGSEFHFSIPLVVDQ
jgi:signal transduction histidine kinase